MGLTIRSKRNKKLWCGFQLSDKEKEFLIRSTLAEFKKPIKDRRTPLELVNEARRVIKHLQPYTSNK